MSSIHPIACGCRACRGPARSEKIGAGHRAAYRLTIVAVLAFGFAVAALLEALS